MPQKFNPVRNPIIGAFEDIGEQIVSQVKQLPKDIGQAAMESVGMKTGGSKQGNQSQTPQMQTGQNEQSYLHQLDDMRTQEEKKAIARKAIAELLRPRKKEPSVWERMQMEEEEKKKQLAEQEKKAKPVHLPSSGVSKMPGLKSVRKAKQFGSELGKNIKSD